MYHFVDESISAPSNTLPGDAAAPDDQMSLDRPAKRGAEFSSEASTGDSCPSADAGHVTPPTGSQSFKRQRMSDSYYNVAQHHGSVSPNTAYDAAAMDANDCGSEQDVASLLRGFFVFIRGLLQFILIIFSHLINSTPQV